MRFFFVGYISSILIPIVYTYTSIFFCHLYNRRQLLRVYVSNMNTSNCLLVLGNRGETLYSVFCDIEMWSTSMNSRDQCHSVTVVKKVVKVEYF